MTEENEEELSINPTHDIYQFFHFDLMLELKSKYGITFQADLMELFGIWSGHNIYDMSLKIFT